MFMKHLSNAPDVSALRELLTTVNVVGCAGKRRAGHQVDGERGDVLSGQFRFALGGSRNGRAGRDPSDGRCWRPVSGSPTVPAIRDPALSCSLRQARHLRVHRPADGMSAISRRPAAANNTS